MKFVICLSACAAFHLMSASLEAKPSQSFSLAPLYPGDEDRQATLAFLPNGNLATVLCSGALRSRDCAMVLFGGIAEKLGVQATTHNRVLANFHRDIFGLAESKVLVELRHGWATLSPDLSTVFTTEISTIPPAINGNLFGVYGNGSFWRLLTLKGAALDQIGQGTGELLSVSRDAVCYRMGDSLVTADLGNHQLGAFRLACPANVGVKAEFAGHDRLLLSDCKRQNILISFLGKQITSLGPDGGWGFRHGWSADYSRISFDIYARRVPGIQRFGELVSALIGGLAGIGAADEQSTGESIRVVDTLTGKRCFTLDIPDLSLGATGTYHADIDPSGRWLAVVSRQTLDIYRLPKVCAGEESGLTGTFTGAME